MPWPASCRDGCSWQAWLLLQTFRRQRRHARAAPAAPPPAIWPGRSGSPPGVSISSKPAPIAMARRARRARCGHSKATSIGTPVKSSTPFPKGVAEAATSCPPGRMLFLRRRSGRSSPTSSRWRRQTSPLLPTPRPRRPLPCARILLPQRGHRQRRNWRKPNGSTRAGPISFRPAPIAMARKGRRARSGLSAAIRPGNPGKYSKPSPMAGAAAAT